MFEVTRIRKAEARINFFEKVNTGGAKIVITPSERYCARVKDLVR